MPEIESVYVDANKEVYSLSDTTARQRIVNLSQQVNEDIQDLRDEFQNSVDTICEHIEDKGSEVAEPHSLKNVCDAIDAITTAGNYATLEVREDGEYKAAKDPRGIDAYDIVVVSKDVGQSHVVNFLNGRQLLQTVVVPYAGNAIFDQVAAGGYPESDIPSQSFIGWNPNPINVKTNLNCYAQFKDKSITIDEIGDNWQTIVDKQGADYPLGSYKRLDYQATYTAKELRDCWSPYSTQSYSNFSDLADDQPITVALSFLLVKVAEGEDGTTSTWLSSPIPCTNNHSSNWDFTTGYMMALPQGNGAQNLDYRNFIGRSFLNGPFKEHMPEIFKNQIKPIIKYTQYGTNAQPPYDIVATEEYIWIPSVKEMVTTDVTISCCNTTYDETKYVDSVPGALSYFREELPLTTSQ